MSKLVWLGQSGDLSTSKALNFQDSYRCPVCRHGKLNGLLLMDAYSCNVCHHIFAADLEQQSIRLADSPQQLQWLWTGRGWRPLVRPAADPELEVWLMASILMVLPAVLVFLSYWLFPPLPNDAWSWFPLFWTALTLLGHSVLVLWLLVEHYQFPPYVSFKVSLQRWEGRL